MYEANNTANGEVKTTNPQDSQVVNDKPKKKFHFNWKKFVGYFFLGILVLGIGYLGYRFYEFKPYRVIVSNVTSRSATISWVTDSAEPGMVVYKEGNTILPIWISKYGMGNGYDDRDYSNAELEAANKTQENIAESGDITADDIETEVIVTELGMYWSHHVSIRNLNPETEYEFMVGDGLVFEKVNTVDTEDNVVSTLKERDEIETPIPAYGIVRYYYSEDEEASYLRSNDAIVYVTVYEDLREVESQLISSSTNVDGGWYVDLSNALAEDGESFWDYLSNSTEEYGDATNISLKLTIENAWFGRWSKEINYPGDVAPAKVIDLNQDKESVGDLIYEGMFNGNDEITSLNPFSYISTIYAMTDASGGGANYKNLSTSKQAAAGLLASGGRYAGQASAYYKSIGETAKAAKYKEQSDTLQKAIEEVKKSTNDKVTYTEVKDIIEKAKTETISNGETTMTEDYRLAAKGTCTSDICEKTEEQLKGETGDIEVGRCGYVNNLNCDCTCGEETISIRKGTTCVCSVDSEGNISAKEGGKEVDSIEELEGSEYSTLCPDNNTIKLGKNLDCYSSKNQCYYSAGTLNLSGSECLNGGRWGKEGYTYSSTAVSSQGVSAEDTLVSASDEYKACKDTSSGLVIYALTCGSSYEGIGTSDVLCTYNNKLYAKSSCTGSYSYFDDSNSTICKQTNGSSIKTTTGTCETGFESLDSMGGQIDGQVTCYIYSKITEDGMIYFQSKDANLGYGKIGDPFDDPNCQDYKEVENPGAITSNSGEVSIEVIENINTGDKCFEKKTLSSGQLVIANTNGFFKCNDKGVFEEIDPIYKSFEPNELCDWNRLVTYLKIDGEYKRYECNSGKWKEASGSEDEAVVGIDYNEVSSNSENNTCSVTAGGICGCIYDMITTTRYCSSISKSKTECPENEKVRSTESIQNVKYLTNGGVCEDEEFFNDITTENVEQVLALNLQIFADSQYAISMTENIVQKLGTGTYIFEVEGDTYLVEIADEDIDKDIYLDINGNGIVDDEDKNVSESFETINVKTVRKEFAYTLKEGFNFVSFPFMFYDTNITMASELLEYLNEEYDDAFYSISKYDSGKWTIVGSNGGTYDQNDFQLIPGQGYVLKAKTDIYITLYGNEVTYEYITDSAPIGLSEGWNLVGLYGTSVKSYTAESILADITNYEAIDFTAVNVSRWVESRALYEALQRDEDSTVYGLDFPIELKKSYFIKITNGSGNWEPGIE